MGTKNVGENKEEPEDDKDMCVCCCCYRMQYRSQISAWTKVTASVNHPLIRFDFIYIYPYFLSQFLLPACQAQSNTQPNGLFAFRSLFILKFQNFVSAFNLYIISFSSRCLDFMVAIVCSPSFFFFSFSTLDTARL